MNLKDRVALVTGAGGGIGRGIALKLGSLGARVVAADIREEGERDGFTPGKGRRPSLGAGDGYYQPGPGSDHGSKHPQPLRPAGYSGQ